MENPLIFIGIPVRPFEAGAWQGEALRAMLGYSARRGICVLPPAYATGTSIEANRNQLLKRAR